MKSYSTALLVSLFGVLVGVADPLWSEERAAWTTSRVTGSPDPAKPFQIERVFPKLQFRNPVELRPLRGTDHMLLLQVDGKLLIFENDPQCDQATLILDLGAGRQQMRAFGFGLHPNFESNRQLFVVYSSDTRNVDGAARLARFHIPKEPPFTIEPDSEEIVLSWTSGGHNGSTVQFDREGFLYFSAGDGARPFPPDEFDVGQDLSDLRATICRIDVDAEEGGRPYRIPGDNPFVDMPGARGEIWAYGFRNPWRFTIDQQSGRMLCGDVGWEAWESVFDVRRGGNYGWSIVEGPGPMRGDVPLGPTPIEKPIAAYNHSLGQSITGGVVYRGTALPELKGTYLYGDYVSGLLWGLQFEGTEVVANPILAETGIPIITFAQTANDEVLVVSYTGEIYRLARNPLAGRPSRFPRRLSETGLFESLDRLQPAAGVYEYHIAARAERRGATQRYHVAIPGDQTITVGKQKRQWKYPVDTVFVRTFSHQTVAAADPDNGFIETQLLHFNGLSWQPYSYLWNEDGSDAILVDAAGQSPDSASGKEERSGWFIHSRAQCRSCHTNQAGGAVGFSLENLSERQTDRFVDLGVLNRRAPDAWSLGRMVDPLDESQTIDSRARSYLAANCAHCHRRGGGGSVPLDLVFSNPNDQINAIDEAPMQGDFGIKHAKVVAPGAPSRSVMLYRMCTTGMGKMPKLAHEDLDPLGAVLIHDWIDSMAPGSIAPSDSEPILSDVSRSIQSLIAILKSGDVSEGIRLARAAAERDDPVREGLFERFLPPSERRKVLGPDIDAATILAMNGDADRGKKWLTESRGATCIACHRVGGQGQNVGPALDAIGSRRTPAELLAGILRPSEKVEEKYRSMIVLTEDGEVLTGLPIDQTGSTLTVRTSDGKDHVLDRREIESQRVQTTSIMPEGLAESMTARELADLIAFLSSLR